MLRTLLSLGATVPAVAFAAAVPRDDVATSLEAWFASGCFWGRQHDFAIWEEAALNRTDEEVTAIGGYAGGAGAGGSVCYHNAANKSDYVSLGHTEAIGLRLPPDALAAAAHIYFSSFVALPGSSVYGREDFFDEGPGYRAGIGLPGGFDSPLLASVERAAALHNMTLRRGSGGDADTLGTSSVWVYDSTTFPLHQAELCLQFHNNQTSTYPASYHRLRGALLASGRLVNSSCPQNYVC